MRQGFKKTLLAAAGCLLILSGCTKSNIVAPDEYTAEPDFNIYFDVVIDEEQLHDDVEDIYLDEKDYPMAYFIDFELHLDEEYIDVTVVVKDGTSFEDTAYFADIALKGINDEVAVQDFSYGGSDFDTFGGLYQDNEVNLEIYEESAYKSGGEPIYTLNIPKDEYLVFDIENGTAETLAVPDDPFYRPN